MQPDREAPSSEPPRREIPSRRAARSRRPGSPHQTLTLILVAFAVALGMALAGAVRLAPVSLAESDPRPDLAVAVPRTPVGGLPDFVGLAASVSPAVASVRAIVIDDGPRFPGALGGLLGPRRRGPRRADSGGSGFVISSDGYVVTNHHVVENATELVVRVAGRDYPAAVAGDDPATDLALLKIEAGEPLPYLALGDSRALRVGSWVMVIGSPLSLDNSVSVGVVSAKGRSIDITPDRSLENFVQTDAAINFGNSGGPMVDLEGRVVGIATAINYGAENIGFAVPVDTLKAILPQLKETGEVRRGYLGVEIDELEYEEARAFGLERAAGALVVNVVEDGPADRAGLRHGDVVVAVDDVEVERTRDLIDYVASRSPESEVELEVVRGGERVRFGVELGEREVLGQTAARFDEPQPTEHGIDWLGLHIRDLDPGVRRGHSIPDDVAGAWVVEVDPASPLYEEGLAPGDVVVEANEGPVDSVEDFVDVVEDLPSGGYLKLYVRRFDPRTGESRAFFAIVTVP